jgi:hypothetical protein
MKMIKSAKGFFYSGLQGGEEYVLFHSKAVSGDV